MTNQLESKMEDESNFNESDRSDYNRERKGIEKRDRIGGGNRRRDRKPRGERLRRGDHRERHVCSFIFYIYIMTKGIFTKMYSLVSCE